jgi:hypothetical protein
MTNCKDCEKANSIVEGFAWHRKNKRHAEREGQYGSNICDRCKIMKYEMKDLLEMLPEGSSLPLKVLEGVSKIEQFGAKKYSPESWKSGYTFHDHYDACQRHLHKWSNGIDLDHETGENHLYHAMCRLMFLMWLVENKEEMDDRGIYGKVKD